PTFPVDEYTGTYSCSMTAIQNGDVTDQDVIYEVTVTESGGDAISIFIPDVECGPFKNGSFGAIGDISVECSLTADENGITTFSGETSVVLPIIYQEGTSATLTGDFAEEGRIYFTIEIPAALITLSFDGPIQ
ncbi:MAG TPA: calycin-like domain-containing protein, partial [Candidatus Coprenecus pullistercoris]|nr:calycin-like domain-containing protein [Candidatus Coprenecus pullistercoris]